MPAQTATTDTMLELLSLSLFIGYIVYLRYYADQRTDAQKEADRLREGIDLFDKGQLADALAYFNQAITEQPASSVAYLYRARIYRQLDDDKAALADLERGKRYDDTIADLHLESGQIHYQQGDYQTAFLDFDKAVFHAHGDEAEPYQWRGMTRQKLHQDEASRQDLERAATLTNRPVAAPVRPAGSGPWLDRRFVGHMGLIGLSSALLIVIIKHSSVIHWPYLTAAISGVAIGFLQPRKGWLLAIQQALTLWIGYNLIVGPDTQSTHREVEQFGLYGSIGLTFVGSLLGSVLRRAQG